MNKFDKGSVVIVVFPSTDGTLPVKKRPALVLRKNGKEDLLLCMMTTISRDEPEEVIVPAGEANLKKLTYIRTHKLMTVHESFISRATGSVSKATW
jgi:mRNA-degrading endonuclease toxin of MazEF toxin-antitoxin module